MLTTDQGLILPDLTDNRNVPLSFSDYNAGVESRLVKRYASSAERALRNPSPPEGELSYLLDLNRFDFYTGAAWQTVSAQGVIKRGNRSTNSSTTTTEVGVLRVDGTTLVPGRLYEIYTGPLRFFSSVTGDIVSAALRYRLDGASAGTGDTTLVNAPDKAHTANLDQGASQTLRAQLTVGSISTLSVLLTVGRVAGTGNVAILGGPIDLFIEDMGIDPGDTGVDI